MPQLPQHERLASLADDVVSQLVEETRIRTATASLVRMQAAVLRELVRVEELQPSDLISLADTTELLIKFLTRYADEMYNSQRLLLENLRTELTGVPTPPKPIRFDGLFHFPI